jgi:predicted short-subunit dehydrogenase-like oxidoreductase (DUF2520 family)
VTGVLDLAGSGRALAAAELGGADFVFLAISDDALPDVVQELAVANSGNAAIWLHGSGARGAEVLAPLSKAGKRIAVLHPAASLPHESALAGTPLVATGDPDVREQVLALGRAIGGVPTWVDALDSPLYHAACALLANGPTALYAAGLEMLAASSSGALGATQARALLQSAVEPLATSDPADVLTGPVRRGDAETILAHRRALADSQPDVLRLYDALMHRALVLATEAGLSPAAAARVSEALDRDPNHT